MLANPKWSEWNLPAFIGFAETFPPGEAYDYTRPRHCAIAVWRKFLGLEKISILQPDMPDVFHEIVNPGALTGAMGLPYGFTWGEVVIRARAFAAETATVS